MKKMLTLLLAALCGVAAGSASATPKAAETAQHAVATTASEAPRPQTVRKPVRKSGRKTVKKGKA